MSRIKLEDSEDIVFTIYIELTYYVDIFSVY